MERKARIGCAEDLLGHRAPHCRCHCHCLCFPHDGHPSVNADPLNGYSNAFLEQDPRLHQRGLNPSPYSLSSSEPLCYPSSFLSPVPSTSYGRIPFDALEVSVAALRLSCPSPSSAASGSRVSFLPSCTHNIPQPISNPQLRSMQMSGFSGRPLNHSYLNLTDRLGMENCTCTCCPHQHRLPGNGDAIDWTMPALGTSLQYTASANNVLGGAIGPRTLAVERSLFEDATVPTNLLLDGLFLEEQEVPPVDFAALRDYEGLCNPSAPPRTHRNIEVHGVGLDQYNSLDRLWDETLRTAKRPSGCRHYSPEVVKTGEPEEVVVNISAMMRDSLVAASGELQRGHLLAAVIGNPTKFFDACCDNHGTRAVQKLIEFCYGSEAQRAAILHTLSPYTVQLAMHHFGNHVLQVCLKFFPYEEIKFALDAICAHIVDVVKNQSGCCVVQLCLAVAKGDAKMHLLEGILENTVDFSQDPYGNYVVQYLLKTRQRHIVVDIHRRLKGHYVSLSIQKCSSHVVESCIEYAGRTVRAEIIHELLRSPDALAIMQDRFGNYVMQRALKNAEGEDRQYLVNLIRKHKNILGCHLYGRNVIQKVHRYP